MVYGYVCTECRHPAHKHVWADHTSDFESATFVCPCGCEQPLHGTFVGLGQTAFEQQQRTNPLPGLSS